MNLSVPLHSPAAVVDFTPHFLNGDKNIFISVFYPLHPRSVRKKWGIRSTRWSGLLPGARSAERKIDY
jgi:hypothetical protein